MVAHSSLLKRAWRVLLAASAFTLLAGVPPESPIDLGAGHTLVPRLTFTDQLGQTHTRLVHRYQGLRVWGSELVSHQSKVPGARPTFTSSPALPMVDAETPLAMPLDLDLTPSVPPEAAQEALRPAFGDAAASVTFPSTELVIYPGFIDLPVGQAELDATHLHQHLAGYALAYLIRAEAATGIALNDAWDCLVDAHSGQVLLRIPVNQGATAAPALGAAGAAPAPQAALPLAGGGGNAPAVGVGNSLYNGTVSLNTVANSSGYNLLDTTRGVAGTGVFPGNAVTDMAHSTYGPPSTGTLYANATDVWGNGNPPALLGPTSGPVGQTVAVDADYGLQSTWDYYGQVHGRSGIDGSGTQTYVRVNYGGYSGDVDNAFWQPSTFSMTVQDGVKYWPLNNLTIMGHEFTHGVTGATANLNYYGESGGLNEATSDIFGVMVDTYAREGSGDGTIPNTGTNWYIPEFFATSTPPGQIRYLRYLYKPSLDGLSPNAWSSSLSGMDVHFSSGPMNRAFYFLSQGASGSPASQSYSTYLPGGMTGIGNDEAARLWYRALTVYLTPSSNYKQARTAALLSARDLFPPDASGNPSKETVAVRKAFGAINVGNPNATVDDLVPPSITASVALSGTVTPSGSNLTLGAVPVSPFGVNEVDFFVDQVLVANVLTPPTFTVPQFDAAHLLANGSHSLAASAFDPAGNAGTSLSVPFTLNNPVQQILLDPGFEGGGQVGTASGLVTVWQGDANLVLQTDFTGAIPHGGYRYARFDRSSGAQSLTLSQQVAIPAGFPATFSLWTRIQGNPALGAVDTLQLQVQPVAPGSSATILDTLSNTQNRADWVKRSYSLPSFLLGQTVVVSLVSNIGVGTGTAFLVDDLALTCSAAVPQVQVQVSLNPAAFSAAPLTVDTFASSPAVGPLYAQVTGTQAGASTAVTWSVLEGVGTLTSGPNPTYKPPLSGGFFHVVATSVADPNVSAQVSIQALNGVNIVPAAATIEFGGTLPFTVITSPTLTATLSATGGTISAGSSPTQKVYTAPGVAGTYTITATSSVGGTATLTVTVNPQIQVSIAPNYLNLVSGSSYPLSATVTGSANTDVTWTIQEDPLGGGITGSTDETPPNYVAPATAGTYHVVATSVADPTRSAVLTVNVQTGGIAISPLNPINPPSAPIPACLTGGTIAFLATTVGGLPVTWSVPAGPSAGSVTSTGAFTAPAAAGSYVVTASVAGGLTASITVQVVTTNFSGNGKPTMNSADLAILADAWGSSPGMPNWNPACDLTQSGTVNDQDVTLFFTQFGGLP